MSIVVEHVSFTYSPGTVFETTALRDVSLTIEDGAYVGIMGQTGCGKSTLIQLLVGLMQPTSGQILIDGNDINGRGYNRRRPAAQQLASFFNTLKSSCLKRLSKRMSPLG